MEVDVEVQRRAEALDEDDGSGAGAGAYAQSGAAGEEGGDCPVDDGKDLGKACQVVYDTASPAMRKPLAPPPAS